jgi:hypothetical protein
MPKFRGERTGQLSSEEIESRKDRIKSERQEGEKKEDKRLSREERRKKENEVFVSVTKEVTERLKSLFKDREFDVSKEYDKKIVEFVSSSIIIKKAYDAASKIIDEEERREEEDGIFSWQGAVSHAEWDWKRGSDMTFSRSDLEINPKTGLTYATMDREQTTRSREDVLKKARAACEDLVNE